MTRINTLLTLIILITTSCEYDFEQKTIDTGLTFIEMNKAAIAHSIWQLCYYYDLKDYFELTHKIELAIESIETLCKTLPNDNDCELLLELLKKHMENSQFNVERVESFGSRSKRWAPLGYIGDLNSIIFGYATQEDIQPMVTNIKNLHRNILTQKKLLESQILIMQQSVNLNEKTYSDLKKQVIVLNENLNEFARNTNIKQKVQTLTQIATLVILHHSQVSETLMNILQNSINGKILNLISQKQLKLNLQTISQNLKNSQKLPLNLNHQHPYNIFATTTSKASLSDKKIIIILEIPIVDRDELTLYKTIPIPTEINKKLVIIVPTMKYFLLNANKREITPIEYDEINKCRKTLKNELICSPTSATIIGKEQSCELSLMLDPNHQSIQTLCEFRLVPNRNYFVQIHQHNQYYCVINKPILITESCPNESMSTTSINTNGIIKIRPGCSIITNEIKITSFNTISSTPEILTPLFHISNLGEKILEVAGNVTHLLNQNYSILAFSDHTEEILDISQKLKENLIKVQEKIELNEMIKSIETDIWTTVILITIIIVLIYFTYKKYFT